MPGATEAPLGWSSNTGRLGVRLSDEGSVSSAASAAAAAATAEAPPLVNMLITAVADFPGGRTSHSVSDAAQCDGASLGKPLVAARRRLPALLAASTP